MEIQKLSKKYMVRKLNDTDIDKIYEVMQGNPQYFQYCPPMATAQSIADDMNALPPRTTYDDKYYIGYFEGEKLVAVMDLILNFPNKETAFIGFFMMNTAYQGKGIGRKIIETLEDDEYFTRSNRIEIPSSITTFFNESISLKAEIPISFIVEGIVTSDKYTTP